MQLLFVKYRYNTCLLAFEDYVRYFGYDNILVKHVPVWTTQSFRGR